MKVALDCHWSTDTLYPRRRLLLPPKAQSGLPNVLAVESSTDTGMRLFVMKISLGTDKDCVPNLIRLDTTAPSP